MKVLILTEGGHNIGAGHITRCNAIYEAFRQKGVTPEFIFNGDKWAAGLLGPRGYRVFNWIEEEKKLSGVIRHIDIVIVDSYLAKLNFYKKLSETVSVPVYIDDNKRLNYPRGIVLNGSISAQDLDYPRKGDNTYLLGTAYAPLRKEFWKVSKKRINKTPKTVMITFGSEDSRNMTPKVLRVLIDKFPDTDKKVIIGSGYKNIKAIKKLSDTRTQVIYHPDAGGMKRIMLESDIAISGGGQTLYELARVGLPAVSIAVAGNQLRNVKGWQESGVIEYAGWWGKKDIPDNIYGCISRLKDKEVRIKRNLLGRKLVDGLGAARIADFLCGVSN